MINLQIILPELRTVDQVYFNKDLQDKPNGNIKYRYQVNNCTSTFPIGR